RRIHGNTVWWPPSRAVPRQVPGNRPGARRAPGGGGAVGAGAAATALGRELAAVVPAPGERARQPGLLRRVLPLDVHRGEPCDRRGGALRADVPSPPR